MFVGYGQMDNGKDIHELLSINNMHYENMLNSRVISQILILEIFQY